MTVELYKAPETALTEGIKSPISNTTGELPDQEPALDFGELLGSFDSQEEAVAFIQNQLLQQEQQVTDSRVVPFDAYTHVEWLTLTIQQDDQTTQQNYYLVTDEGY